MRLSDRMRDERRLPRFAYVVRSDHQSPVRDSEGGAGDGRDDAPGGRAAGELSQERLSGSAHHEGPPELEELALPPPEQPVFLRALRKTQPPVERGPPL